MSEGGKKTKGKNFRASELDRMLGIVEDILPFGSEQWTGVASTYNDQLPSGWPDRDGDSLKRKFMNLKNKRKPTGDPDCPSEVKRAKTAFRKIEAHCAVSTLHDDDSDDRSEYETELGQFDSLETPQEPALFEPRVSSTAGTTITQAATSASTIAASSPVAMPPLTATPRSGLTPTQLAQLSRTLPTTTSGQQQGVYLSQTAQRRIRLDKMMEKLASDTSSSMGGTDPSLIGVMVMMDERQAVREADLRREREEREQAREERERQFRWR